MCFISDPTETRLLRWQLRLSDVVAWKVVSKKTLEGMDWGGVKYSPGALVKATGQPGLRVMQAGIYVWKRREDARAWNYSKRIKVIIPKGTKVYGALDDRACVAAVRVVDTRRKAPKRPVKKPAPRKAARKKVVRKRKSA